MLRQSFTFILLLSVMSFIHTQPNPTNMLNKMCEGAMKAITAGTFEKGIKDRNECREKAVSKEVLAAVTKCEELMPMSTADQVKQACSDKDANVPKLTEKLKCEKAALGDDMSKFGECCKKINPDNA